MTAFIWAGGGGIYALVLMEMIKEHNIDCEVSPQLPQVECLTCPSDEHLKPFDNINAKTRKSKGDKARSRKEHRSRYKL